MNCETTSGFAEVNDTRLYFESTGKGTPLIFLHGFTCDHRHWTSQEEYFSDRYRVVTYDARGHGQSAVPDSTPYSYEDDLAALMDFLEIDKAVLVGHSMGGAPAFLFAKHHPERVFALVLGEGGALIKDPALVDISNFQEYMTELATAMAVARAHGIEQCKKAWLDVQPLRTAAKNPKSSALLKAMIADYSGWHWLNSDADPQKEIPDGTPELLASIGTPTLIVVGENSHQFIREQATVQSRYMPNSTLVFLKQANHMLNIENPEQFNRALDSFLLENGLT